MKYNLNHKAIDVFNGRMAGSLEFTELLLDHVTKLLLVSGHGLSPIAGLLGKCRRCTELVP